jgi:hypothetical protein
MSSFVILSIIGPHAVEGQDSIIDRKIGDIKTCGQSFWFFKATRYCDPVLAQKSQVSIVRFIAPKVVGGAKDTKTANRVREYSFDKEQWIPLDPHMSPVTGKIHKGSACFNLRKLTCENLVPHDLSQYTNLDGGPVKFDITKSTQIVSTVKSGDIAPNPQPRRLVFTGTLDDNHPLVYVR